MRPDKRMPPIEPSSCRNERSLSLSGESKAASASVARRISCQLQRVSGARDRRGGSRKRMAPIPGTSREGTAHFLLRGPPTPAVVAGAV